MGGIGSGRVRLRRARETVDRHWSIDIRQWKQKGLLVAPKEFIWNWFNADRVAASMLVQVETGRVKLMHTARFQDRPESLHYYSVYFTSTECHFGGERRWFLCPVADCGRRVAILYAGDIFACRRCQQLVYMSQQESRSSRTIRKVNQIRERLGWSMGFANGYGEKPPNMHWRTFDSLIAKHDMLVGFWLDHVGKTSNHKDV